MRLFVAAYPPEPVREDFGALVSRLCVGQPRPPGRSVRLIPPDQWHLTLAFLGDVPDRKVDKASRAVDRAAHTTPTPPVVRIAGGGTFGRGRFTVLWAGLRGEVPAVAGLSGILGRELSKAHLPYDHKPFRPHVTVARPADRVTADELAGDLGVLDGYEGPPWTVATIRLMRSHLGPHPSYDVLYEAALPG